jgi:hypothetical protein
LSKQKVITSPVHEQDLIEALTSYVIEKSSKNLFRDFRRLGKRLVGKANLSSIKAELVNAMKQRLLCQTRVFETDEMLLMAECKR